MKVLTIEERIKWAKANDMELPTITNHKKRIKSVKTVTRLTRTQRRKSRSEKKIELIKSGFGAGNIIFK